MNTPATTTTQPTRDGSLEFFRISCAYSIDPEAPAKDLLEDCVCLLEAGLNAAEILFDHMDLGRTKEAGAAWACTYLLRQSYAVLQRALMARGTDKLAG